MSSLRCFASGEDGAVTVDWVVLTAAMMGLGIAATLTVSGGVEDLSGDIAVQLNDTRTIVGSSFDLLKLQSFEDVSGLSAAGWGFYSRDSSYGGWDLLDGNSFEIVESGHMGVQAADGDYWLDLEAGRGQHLTVGRILDDAIDGQKYTLSLSAADRYVGNTATVYWGGEEVGTVDPAGKTMEQFSFDMIGGAGDGSNMLMIEGIGADDGYGVSLDAVSVR